MFQNKSVDLKSVTRISVWHSQRTKYTSVVRHWSTFNSCCGQLLIAGIYRRSDSRATLFTENLTQYFEKIKLLKSTSTPIAGDFNLNLLEGSNSTINFKNLFKSYRFNSKINTATRVTVDSSPCIDHFVTNICLFSALLWHFFCPIKVIKRKEDARLKWLPEKIIEHKKIMIKNIRSEKTNFYWHNNMEYKRSLDKIIGRLSWIPRQTGLTKG